ncbi:helix-turn-helix domain-containing protein [Streptococcus oricebi]|uniref:HTH cro/C1-type domain-containing protein n=1 Tax=Streptococcus oricebi TaxID=1547447 RepID=A0ABS5B653_9STRE|nr:helix-turn-helix transcriptional regulator [Streptococcus oricebi]MBP2624230.1 hypothetical protein [Streptococcus oricebi]
MSNSLTTYGAAFRKLRQDRGFNLKEAAGDIISPQFLSKFERNQSGITLENFGRLLVRIGASWDDFLNYFEGESVNRLLGEMREDINNIYSTEDFYKMSQIAKKSAGLSYSDNPFLKNLFACLTKIHLQNLTKQGASLEQEIDQLKTYLARIDTWGDLEWTIYPFVLPQCSIDMVRFRTKQAFQILLDHSDRVAYDARVFIYCIFHALKYFHTLAAYEDANYFIQLLTEEFKKSKYITFTYEYLYLKCYTAIISLCQKDAGGIEAAKSCLQLMEMLEEDFGMTYLTVTKNNFFSSINQIRPEEDPIEW